MEFLAAGVAGGLFSYNRENFFFDGEQRIKREYQGQTMRVKQFELFREDIRDLMELTTAKMDNYLIVNTIQIGLVVVLFTEGRPEPGVSPPWLLFLWAASGAGAFMYIMLCIWLAMHASICSHSFCVRMLTQLVRLPIPNKEQMDAARVLATDFEGTQTREMFRVPVVSQQLKKLQKMVDQADAEDAIPSNMSDTASDPGAEETMLDSAGQPVATDTLSHVKLYRRMQANWQAYDAYARVSMAMGTNQFLQQLGYTTLIGFVSENGSVLPGMCSVIIFSFCAALLIRLDLYVSSYSLLFALFLNTVPSFIAGICLILHSMKGHEYLQLCGDSLVPVPIFLHIVWLVVLLLWAQGRTINGIALPTTFRAVMYLDVFGWLSARRQQEMHWSRQPTEQSAAEAGETGATASFRLSFVREEEPMQVENIRVPFLPNPEPEREGRRGLEVPSRDLPARSASSTTSGEVDSLWHGSHDQEHGGPGDPAQETPTGGGEAVQLAESEVVQRASAADPAHEASGASFHLHPHRSPASRIERVDRHKNPGHLPWSTIQQGSIVLICAWCAGFVWSILRLMTDVVDILKPPKPKPPTLELLFDGPWPQFFEPQGMTCQRDGAEPKFWLLERYAVHQLAGTDGWALRISTEEAGCLSKAPKFHSAGLRGISMRCTELASTKACSTLLVGEDGNVLSCNSSGHSQLFLHGGAWQLAATSDGSGLWAKKLTEASGAPAFLRPISLTGASAVQEYVPVKELGQAAAASNQRWIDLLEGGGLLALSDSGVLQAWGPTPSSDLWYPSGWSFDLSTESGLRWRGFCIVGRTAFFLGKSRTGRIELLKMELPPLSSGP